MEPRQRKGGEGDGKGGRKEGRKSVRGRGEKKEYWVMGGDKDLNVPYR